jgi:hypothetical protein
LGVSAAKKDDSVFCMSPLGISSVKTGVGGNSTSGGGDVMEIDSENRLDAIEARDPVKLIRLIRGVELALLKLAPLA